MSDGKKPRQYIKVVLGVIIAIASMGVVASFALAFLGMNTNSEVTVSLIVTLLGATVTYGIKELGEKKSRNEHGLDENGVPYKKEEE